MPGCRSRVRRIAAELGVTVGAVVDPLARGGDPLPRSHHGGMADHGHQVAMPPRLRPQDAEAVLQVVEGDALDQTGQDLPVRGLWMLAGAGFHDVPSAGAVSSSFTRSNCRARRCGPFTGNGHALWCRSPFWVCSTRSLTAPGERHLPQLFNIDRDIPRTPDQMG